jgi:hypothetical protein
MIEVTFDVINTIQNLIQIDQSVQKLLTGFFTATSEVILEWLKLLDSKMWHRSHLQLHHLPINFHENPPIGSKVISRKHTDGQTAWCFESGLIRKINPMTMLN